MTPKTSVSSSRSAATRWQTLAAVVSATGLIMPSWSICMTASRSAAVQQREAAPTGSSSVNKRSTTRCAMLTWIGPGAAGSEGALQAGLGGPMPRGVSGISGTLPEERQPRLSCRRPGRPDRPAPARTYN